MNYLFKLLLCFSFFSTKEERKEAKQEALRYEIITNFDNNQAKLGYKFCFRMVCAPDKFNGYRLSYYGTQKQTQDDARKHLIINLEKLLSTLNSESGLADSFYRHPLTNHDIHILYSNFESEGVSVKPPYVSAVSNYRDVIEFRFSKTDNIDEDEVVIEPYTEAYQKVFGHPRP